MTESLTKTFDDSLNRRHSPSNDSLNRLNSLLDLVFNLYDSNEISAEIGDRIEYETVKFHNTLTKMIANPRRYRDASKLKDDEAKRKERSDYNRKYHNKRKEEIKNMVNELDNHKRYINRIGLDEVPKVAPSLPRRLGPGSPKRPLISVKRS
jgi:hypothetical protein